MATIRHFEELPVWQAARSLAKEVYHVSRVGEFARDFGLRDQVCRAAVSIASNIAEGYERENNKEFLHFLRIAKGSAAEVRTQLYVAFDIGYLDQATCLSLLNTTGELIRQIVGLSSYLRNLPAEQDNP